MARISLFKRRPGPPPAEEPGDEIQSEAGPATVAEEASEAGPAEAPPPRRPPYHPGVLRRERRALVRAREDRIRDLGGLILEMFRRDRFREDLMREQADEIFGMEARIQEIDGFLTAARKEVQTARCVCGAPVVWGAHFCANCGRPTGETVVSCPSCGHPLPGDARFCVNCGTAAADQATPDPIVLPPADPAVPPPSEPAQDPWEK